jgi:hypothetical protein
MNNDILDEQDQLKVLGIAECIENPATQRRSHLFYYNQRRSQTRSSFGTNHLDLDFFKK